MKSSSVNSIEFRTKSLHFNQRKAELERIERENQKIAKKIFGLKSDLNNNNFLRDFQKHEQMRQNLAKIRKKRVPTYAGKGGHLPPLDEERQGSAPIKETNDLVDNSEGLVHGDYQTQQEVQNRQLDENSEAPAEQPGAAEETAAAPVEEQQPPASGE